MNSSIVADLNLLGLKTNLEGQHGHSYVAVINNGSVVYEQLGQNEEPIVFDTDIGPNRLHITSRVYKNGNEAVIDINGKNYSVNERGLNIVVYNKLTKSLVDSVSFDTHTNSFSCKRNK